MSQTSEYKPNPPQNKDNKPSISENNQPCSLKLVISNPALLPVASAPSQPALSRVEFSAKVRSKGYNLFEMNIQDPFHDLGCDLILEIEKSRGETTAVCHFPAILNESNKFLDEDETLYGIIVVQFQMKALEQLFLFCADHDASRLTIYMDDAQAEGFGIYHDFLSHYDETLTEKGEQTEMVIPTDRKAFDQWRAFMKKTSLAFEQDLWRGQRDNPAIRRYLKSCPQG